MKDYIYNWLMKQIKKPFTEERAEAVYYVLYLLRKSGYEAPEWEAIINYLADGDRLTYEAIVDILKN